MRIKFILGFILMAILVILAVFLSKEYKPNPQQKINSLYSTQNSPQQATLESLPLLDVKDTSIPKSEVPIKAWKTYINKKGGYSFEYPGDWIVKVCGYGEFEGLNLHLNDQPLGDNYCLPSEKPPTEFAKISISSTEGQTVDEIAEDALKQGNIAIDLNKKLANIEGKKYTQITFHIRIVPPFVSFF